MPLPESFEKIVDQAQKEMLYKALIKQLNKDLQLVNIDRQFSIDINPEELKKEFQFLVKQIMEAEFDKYLNLLYVIDVSESKIKKIEEVEIELLSAKVSFLILQREWQKVWIRHQLS